MTIERFYELLLVAIAKCNTLEELQRVKKLERDFRNQVFKRLAAA